MTSHFYLDLDTFLPWKWAPTVDPYQGSCYRAYTWFQKRRAGILYFDPNICREEKSGLQMWLWAFSSQGMATSPKQAFDSLAHVQFRQSLLYVCHAEADHRPHSSKSCYLVLCTWPMGLFISDSLLYLMTMTPVGGNRSSLTEDMPTFSCVWVTAGCSKLEVLIKTLLVYLLWVIFS